jgi:hypothetical protein
MNNKSIIDNFIFSPPKINENTYTNLPNIHKIKSKNNNNIHFSKYLPNNTKNETPNMNYIIFSHGNACDMSSMNDYLQYLSNELDVCVINYDYCGYGLSTGEANENNCYDSLSSIIKYLLKNNVVHTNIFLIGQSLGTGVVKHTTCVSLRSVRYTHDFVRLILLGTLYVFI